MEPKQSRKALEEKLIEQSLKDENFRKTLLENPREAREKN